ncbi:MAG: NfeD family protein [Armatimonadota bacterium]
METQPSWVWMGFAALFIIMEIFTAGFFLFWFGMGAAAAGVLALFGVGAIWQWIAFVVVSGVLFLGSRRFADRFTQRQPPGVGADRYLGRHGVVFEEVNPLRNTGRVRLGTEEWRARSETGELIPIDIPVTVVKVDGTALVVHPEKEKN